MQKRNVQVTVNNKLPWRKKRVCAYVRVSTKHDLQINSLENQIEYYTRYILRNPNYEFCGVYSDTGVSGLSESRPGLNEMLKKAYNGEIDLIITKSISRFSRNTVFLLKTLRKLKEAEVDVYFEKENITSFSLEGEMLLTLLGSFAEEERKSVCENVKWSVRKKFQRGIFQVNTNNLLGYDKDEKGHLVINEEQAEIVRLIFKEYLDGTPAEKIAQKLNELKIPTYNNYQWSGQRILRIISNEKYKGDVLLQKSFVDEYGKYRKNKGQLDKYYIHNNHEAIISREDWQRAQEIRKSRERKQYPFSSRLHCYKCGGVLIRKKSPWGVDWVCSTYLNHGKKTCDGIFIPEDILYKITTNDHLQGDWVAWEDENGETDKRKKSYYLLPADKK